MTIQRGALSSLHSSVPNESHRRRGARKNGRDKSNTKSDSVQRVGGGDARYAVCIELELVQQAVASDADAWDQLYGMCAPRLYPPAFAVLRNREDAEDAVQDCWLRAYANLKSFQGRSSFSTWLTRIAINSALMILRKKRNELEASGHDLDEIQKESLRLRLFDASPGPEQIYTEKERKSLLNTAIANLRPRLRTAVQMGQLRERSMKEAAHTLGISLAAVKARVFHARVALRKSRVLNAIVYRNANWRRETAQRLDASPVTMKSKGTYRGGTGN